MEDGDIKVNNKNHKVDIDQEKLDELRQVQRDASSSMKEAIQEIANEDNIKSMEESFNVVLDSFESFFSTLSKGLGDLKEEMENIDLDINTKDDKDVKDDKNDMK